MAVVTSAISVQQGRDGGSGVGPSEPRITAGGGGIVWLTVRAEEKPSVSQTVKLLFLWLVASRLLCSQIIFPVKFLDQLAVLTEVTFPRAKSGFVYYCMRGRCSAQRNMSAFVDLCV